MNSEEEVSKNITVALSKAVLYICAAAVFGMWIYSCNLDPLIIEECRVACQDSGAKMESVTSGKCTCLDGSDIIQPNSWVLPK
jgi:hypothetical protein